MRTKWDRHARIDLFLSCMFDVEFLQLFNCSFWNMVLKKAIMLCKVRFILILIKIHVANFKLPSLPTSRGKIRTANHDAFSSWFRFHSQLRTHIPLNIKIHSELNKFTNASQHHQCQRKNDSQISVISGCMMYQKFAKQILPKSIYFPQLPTWQPDSPRLARSPGSSQLRCCTARLWIQHSWLTPWRAGCEWNGPLGLKGFSHGGCGLGFQTLQICVPFCRHVFFEMVLVPQMVFGADLFLTPRWPETAWTLKM